MSSTSVRVSEELLEKLHDAQAEGASLGHVIETALEAAGGPSAVRSKLEADARRGRARARVARLRRMGHRSVVLDPGEQVALAEGARRKVALERARGDRRFDPDDGTLILSSDRTADGSRVGGGPRAGPILEGRRSEAAR